MRKSLAFLVLLLALCVFLGLGAYQLGLPGLHYDEAKEAGLNAMELLTGQPVTAFRDATVQIGRLRLPLMVQDYIGNLNVLLAVPLLAVGGINTVALRWLPLLIAALTLLLTWRVAGRLGGPVAAAATALLLAVNPAFIFWSRQGIFVTNLTVLLLVASLLTGLRWWQSRRAADLWLTAFLWGLGLYAKLLFAWAIAAMAGAAAVAWLLEVRRRKAEGGRWTARSAGVEAGSRPRTSTRALILTSALAAVFFLVPLAPLIAFNIRTGGTVATLFGNLGHSYYGVDNSAYLPNLQTRLQQVGALVRGDFFWYLGEMFADAAAPWLLLGLVALAGVAWGLARRRTGSGFLPLLVPAGLLVLIIAQSAFTVSDLFITHYALLVPLLALTGGTAVGAVWEAGRRGAPGDPRGLGAAADENARGNDFSRSTWPAATEVATTNRAIFGAAPQSSAARSRRARPPSPVLFLRTVALLALLAWAGGDLWTTLRYHAVLTASGGVGGHSDAIYALAEHLDHAGTGPVVALDWGLDAPVRFLTQGRVQPVELFGYADLAQPDAGFAARVEPFLAQGDTLYLAHAADKAVFRGRVEALAALAGARGLALREAARFTERSGNPALIVYRVVK